MDPQGKAKVALTFALYQGDQLVRRDTIAQDIVKVGKDPRSHLRVDDDLASRMHAVIEVAPPLFRCRCSAECCEEEQRALL